MSSVNIFNGKRLELWLYMDVHEKVWIKGLEVAQFFEYDIAKMDEDFLAMFAFIKIPDKPVPNEWSNNSVFIDEAGLFEVLLCSGREDVRKIHRWLSATVLPTFKERLQPKELLHLRDRELRKQAEKRAEEVILSYKALVELCTKIANVLVCVVSNK